MQTIDCHKCESLLYQYVHPDERSGETWRRVAQHLERCSHYSGAFSELSELVELAKGSRESSRRIIPAPICRFSAQAGGRWRWTMAGPGWKKRRGAGVN